MKSVVFAVADLVNWFRLPRVCNIASFVRDWCAILFGMGRKKIQTAVSVTI